jgi:hypothetical protein
MKPKKHKNPTAPRWLRIARELEDKLSEFGELIDRITAPAPPAEFFAAGDQVFRFTGFIGVVGAAGSGARFDEASGKFHFCSEQPERITRATVTHICYIWEPYFLRPDPGGALRLQVDTAARALGLDPSKALTSQQVRRAYLERIRQHHPDRNPGDAGSEAKAKEITAAYTFLKDQGLVTE